MPASRQAGLYLKTCPVSLVNARDARRIRCRGSSEGRSELPRNVGERDTGDGIVVGAGTPSRSPNAPYLPAREAASTPHPYGVPEKSVERSEGIRAGSFVGYVRGIGRNLLLFLDDSLDNGGNAGIERSLSRDSFRSQRVVIDETPA